MAYVQWEATFPRLQLAVLQRVHPEPVEHRRLAVRREQLHEYKADCSAEAEASSVLEHVTLRRRRRSSGRWGC